MVTTTGKSPEGFFLLKDPEGFKTGNDLLDAALNYASFGWPVVPLHSPVDLAQGLLCSCSRWAEGECTSPGKHPRLKNGLKEASMDQQIIAGWWKQWPKANVGVCTGRYPWAAYGGVAVVDVDPRHGGDDSLMRLNADMDLALDTVTADTGSGGMHLLYEMRDLEIHNSAGILGPGLDVRGLGGYIVAAPSLHPSGGRYSWVVDFGPTETEMRPFPTDLWAMLSARRPAIPTKSDWTTGPESIISGQRNVMLTSLAGTMRRRGMGQEEILAALVKTNELRCQPALRPGEVDQIVGHVMRYTPDQLDDVPVQPGGVRITGSASQESWD